MTTTTTPSTSSLWAKDLDLASQKLCQTANIISQSFQERNVPDPVHLVQRIQSLEDTMHRLASDCAEIDETKRKIVLNLLQLQVQNAQLLRKVSSSKYNDDDDDNVDEDMNQWQKVASSVEEQRDLLLMQSRDDPDTSKEPFLRKGRQTL